MRPEAPPRHVAVVYASAADRVAVARAVAVAGTFRARLTLAVPIGEPSALCYLSLFSIEHLREDLEVEAERLASRVLAGIPDSVPVTVRTFRRASASLVLSSPPVDLLVHRQDGGDGGRRLRSSLLVRVARKAKVPVDVVGGTGRDGQSAHG
jgi:nucleotide-binding universal stress UspA family protein